MDSLKVHILNLGCPKNLVDGEIMAASLAESGFTLTETPENAGIILVNTCAFILPAKEESIEEILRMARFKNEGMGQCRYLVVAGCLPQRYGKDLKQALPEVDLFLGTSDVPLLARRIDDLMANKGRRSHIGKPNFLMNSGHKRILATPSHSAYIKIADGCSNRCTYCVIPDIRGRARSRKPDDILEEAQALVARGVKEIILIAQDTTAYGEDFKGKPNLAGLLKDLASLDTLHWIRILYTYPSRLTEALFQVMADGKKVCAYIDMPIQHADNDILRAMNRRGDTSQIAWAIQTAQATIPDIALRTSVIVGFPGETSRRFGKLVDFVKASRFDHLGAFVYSREEGTIAAEKPSRISEEEKTRRRNLIMEEQASISYEINQRLIGSRQEILVEGQSDVPDYPYIGRCRRQAPEIDGITYVKGKNLVVGDIVDGRIVEAEEYDLFAIIEKDGDGHGPSTRT
ncbi:MAG: Ribosomal protein S12 methylthiotransferase RimO [Syntrophus sp. SKADARSKE-3]|nr:Ribosomal protein S12 methylthiotransferase RimO [Syntrophus sp. SKADARSKE-3]